MRCYKIGYDNRNVKPNKAIYCDKYENIPERYIIDEGRSLEKIWKKVVFSYNYKGKNVFTDYLGNVLGWLIMSDKFIKLTEEYLKDSIEYLSVDIKERRTNNIVHNFKVLNIINVLDNAIDFEKSHYFKIGDEKNYYLNIPKPVLKRQQIEGQHIFRIQEKMISIFVSEKIKNIIEENNLTGFYFYEVGLS